MSEPDRRTDADRRPDASRKPETGRRPAAFRLDDPHVLVAEAAVGEDTRARPRRAVIVTPEPDIADLPLAIAPQLARARSRRIPWARLFWSAAGGLLSIAVSVAVVRFIEDLFARSDWLGWVALALAILAGGGAIRHHAA